MISNDYEVFHVKDFVIQEKTLYHYHDFYEIHCTLMGTAEFYLDGQQYLLKPGSVIFIHNLDLHRIVKQNSDFFERVYMFITPSFLKKRSSKYTNLERCFHPTGRTKSKIIQTDPEKLRYYLSLIEAPADKKEYGLDLMYEQQFVNFLVYLNKLVMNEEKEVQPKQATENTLIEDLMNYVSENLSEPLTLDDVAKEFFVSKYYISRTFKSSTGFTFHNYVLKKKLLYAKQLLVTYKNSNEIYLQCGFKSYPHFLKCFKKEFGMTPKEFLKKHHTQEVVFFDHHQA
ncbi:AraC family transcriptional regulator [Enterococcus sp. LJL51]|uniref:AraC family transcriptional regulator n=1 Tax=Enterococcus sp. LJL51 TaxID=3416656 RepID=UPI003CE718FC